MELSGMHFINEAIKTIILSCCVKNSKPVSCLLIGPSGGGKSVTLLRWRAPWIHHTNDITSSGMQELISRDPTNKIRSIILPDFNIPLSHKQAVVTLTVSNLLSLMAEGTTRVDDARGVKECKHAPVSIISAATPDMYISHYRKWRALGFLRRFLMINFRYSLQTRREGNELIRREKINSGLLPETALTLPKNPEGFEVHLEDREAREIEGLSNELAKNLGYTIVRDYKTRQVKWNSNEPALEFSPHLMLQSIAKANALKGGSHKVRKTDIEFLVELLEFTNPSNPKQI